MFHKSVMRMKKSRSISNVAVKDNVYDRKTGESALCFDQILDPYFCPAGDGDREGSKHRCSSTVCVPQSLEHNIYIHEPVL